MCLPLHALSFGSIQRLPQLRPCTSFVPGGHCFEVTQEFPIRAASDKSSSVSSSSGCCAHWLHSLCPVMVGLRMNPYHSSLLTSDVTGNPWCSVVGDASLPFLPLPSLGPEHALSFVSSSSCMSDTLLALTLVRTPTFGFWVHSGDPG
jgi:hypothetical protein